MLPWSNWLKELLLKFCVAENLQDRSEKVNILSSRIQIG